MEPTFYQMKTSTKSNIQLQTLKTITKFSILETQSKTYHFRINVYLVV